MDILVAKARDLARRAHAEQVDKAGRPYFEHLERVAGDVGASPLAQAVAWLHDLLEDAPQYETELRLYPAEVLAAVRTLTRERGTTPEAYYARVRAHPLALQVKLADIADNANEKRLALLPPETAARLRQKYAHARAELVEREARIYLVPCPFCSGPPVPIVSRFGGGGVAPVKKDYGANGMMVEAFVFCHECGAQGPSADALIYERVEYLEVRQKAIQLWQQRDTRHSDLFAAGAREGLNLFPRPDLPEEEAS